MEKLFAIVGTWGMSGGTFTGTISVFNDRVLALAFQEDFLQANKNIIRVTQEKNLPMTPQHEHALGIAVDYRSSVIIETDKDSPFVYDQPINPTLSDKYPHLATFLDQSVNNSVFTVTGQSWVNGQNKSVVLGIFTDKQKAEKYLEDYSRVIEAGKQIPVPDNFPSKAWSDDDFTQYDKWLNMHKWSTGFIKAWIDEVTLNPGQPVIINYEITNQA